MGTELNRIIRYRTNQYTKRIRQAIHLTNKYTEYVENSTDASVLNSEVMYMLNTIKTNLMEPPRAKYFSKEPKA